jgi:hypothetical protein
VFLAIVFTNGKKAAASWLFCAPIEEEKTRRDENGSKGEIKIDLSLGAFISYRIGSL